MYSQEQSEQRTPNKTELDWVTRHQNFNMPVRVLIYGKYPKKLLDFDSKMSQFFCNTTTILGSR